LTRVNAIKSVESLTRNGHPDGLHRQTRPIGHSPQFPPDRVAAGGGEHLGKHVPHEGVALHVMRQDQLRLTQRPYRIIAPSPHRASARP
jgi:hypothetical protein